MSSLERLAGRLTDLGLAVLPKGWEVLAGLVLTLAVPAALGGLTLWAFLAATGE